MLPTSDNRDVPQTLDNNFKEVLKHKTRRFDIRNCCNIHVHLRAQQ